MSMTVLDFQNCIISAQLLLANEMPVDEDTIKFAKTTLFGLKKCVEDITDASIRPDVSSETRTQARRLLETVKTIQQTTIPTLRNKFSIGLSPEAVLGIRMGSFLVMIGLNSYTGILESIQNVFLKNLILSIAAQKINDLITFSLD